MLIIIAEIWYELNKIINIPLALFCQVKDGCKLFSYYNKTRGPKKISEGGKMEFFHNMNSKLLRGLSNMKKIHVNTRYNHGLTAAIHKLELMCCLLTLVFLITLVFPSVASADSPKIQKVAKVVKVVKVVGAVTKARDTGNRISDIAIGRNRAAEQAFDHGWKNGIRDANRVSNNPNVTFIDVDWEAKYRKNGLEKAYAAGHYAGFKDEVKKRR